MWFECDMKGLLGVAGGVPKAVWVKSHAGEPQPRPARMVRSPGPLGPAQALRLERFWLVRDHGRSLINSRGFCSERWGGGAFASRTLGGVHLTYGPRQDWLVGGPLGPVRSMDVHAVRFCSDL